MGGRTGFDARLCVGYLFFAVLLSCKLSTAQNSTNGAAGGSAGASGSATNGTGAGGMGGSMGAGLGSGMGSMGGGMGGGMGALMQDPFGQPPVAQGPAEEEGPKICEGKLPAKLVIAKVVPYPVDGQVPEILIRNMGGQTANLKGWRMTDSDTRKTDAAMNHIFGAVEDCDEGNYTIKASQTLTISPKSEQNPCGYPFAISFRDEINLFDAKDALIANVKWEDSQQGMELHLMPDNTYRALPSTKDVVQILADLGNYTVFLEALTATGLAPALSAASDPSYPGPRMPPPPPRKEIQPQFPWWFLSSVNRSALPPPPPPPPPSPPPAPGIPAAGPYTLLAPTDAAFDVLLATLGGGKRLPKGELMKLPELKEILMYHIIPGSYNSPYLFNNTGIWTAKGVEVVPFTDGCMTEGVIMLHDACVDKPTPDQYTCEEQAKFEKCYFPFMTSALAAQWQGGFCQRSCGRCSCSPESGITCAQMHLVDVKASNGYVHGVSRVLFPPPVFEKIIAAPGTELNFNSSAPLTDEAALEFAKSTNASATDTGFTSSAPATGRR